MLLKQNKINTTRKPKESIIFNNDKLQYFNRSSLSTSRNNKRTSIS